MALGNVFRQSVSSTSNSGKYNFIMSFSNWLVFIFVFPPDPIVYECVHISCLWSAHDKLLWSTSWTACSQALWLQNPGRNSGNTPRDRSGSEHNHNSSTNQGTQSAAGLTLGAFSWFLFVCFPVAEAATKFYVTLWREVRRHNIMDSRIPVQIKNESQRLIVSSLQFVIS